MNAEWEDLMWMEYERFMDELILEPVPDPEPEVEEPRRPSRKELKRRTKERNDARKFKAWRTAQAE